jgi:hyperosmotically inducible periplasmic protein
MCASEPRRAGRIGIIAADLTQGQHMKIKTIATCVAMSALLGSAAVMAADATDATSPAPTSIVKDSVITTKIKTKLAADHLTSMGRISVDTDKDGVVWMSGTAGTQEAVDQALTIARETEGVKSVHSDLTVKKSD